MRKPISSSPGRKRPGCPHSGFGERCTRQASPAGECSAVCNPDDSVNPRTKPGMQQEELRPFKQNHLIVDDIAHGGLLHRLRLVERSQNYVASALHLQRANRGLTISTLHNPGRYIVANRVRTDPLSGQCRQRPPRQSGIMRHDAMYPEARQRLIDPA